jgi:hypothetical protein
MSNIDRDGDGVKRLSFAPIPVELLKNPVGIFSTFERQVFAAILALAAASPVTRQHRFETANRKRKADLDRMRN